jgi:DNA replication ATP-dependent helicase Dna2
MKTFLYTSRGSWTSKDKDIFKLKTFQKLEQDCSSEQYNRNYNLPIEIRVKKGIALTNLRIQELQPFGKYRLLCVEENNSKFRIGDYIKIHSEIEFDQNSVEAQISAEGDNYYDVILKKGSLNFYMTNEISIIIDYSFTNITGQIINDALYILENHEKKNIILNIINGKAIIEKDKSIFTKLNNKDFYDGKIKERFISLDKFQRKAFIDSVTDSPITLIQGPPGTGKTTVLAFLCNFLASEGKNILVTGFTHKSINNALKSIWDYSENRDRIIKISDEYKTTEFTDSYGNIPVSKRFDKSLFYASNEIGLIVGATPFEVTRMEFHNIKFDYVIFDEASQLHVNLAILGMLKGDKYVFFGDHMQMKPIILGNPEINQLYKKKIFNQSIFEYLYNSYGGVTLLKCYRMNPKLISFSSTQFYGGKVFTPAKNKRKLLKLTSNPSKHIDVLNPRNVDVVVQVRKSKDENKSKTEAVLISEFIEELIKCGVKPTDIGVIAPYRPQITLIKTELRKICSVSDNIIVETVERIQGQERDVFIFSLTRSNLDTSIEDLDFFFTPNRLNVALTRAKCKRIVVASETLFRKNKIDKSINKKIKYFTDFLNNADDTIIY